jgi:hypothetical protein
VSKSPPISLLDHPARVLGDAIELSRRAPEALKDFARAKLAQRGVTTEAGRRLAMEGDDPQALDAAWLFEHASAGLLMIEASAAETRDQLRDLWMHAFHAGARHETITVNMRYLTDVQAQHARRTDLPAKARDARRLKLKRRPNLTRRKYTLAANRARNRKELYSILGLSAPTVLSFEKENPGLRKK